MSESLMSADEKPRDGPGTAGKPIVSQAILSWMEREGCPEIFAPEQELQTEKSESALPAAEAEPQGDETLSNLLRAIQGTDIAAELEGTAPPGARLLGPTVNAGFGVPVADPQREEVATPAAPPTKMRRARGAGKSGKTAKREGKRAGKVASAEVLSPPSEIKPEAAAAEALVPQILSSAARIPDVPLCAPEAPELPAVPPPHPVFLAPMLPVVAPQVTAEIPPATEPNSTEMIESAVLPAARAVAVQAPSAAAPAPRNVPLEVEFAKTPTLEEPEGETGVLAGTISAATERLTRAGRQFSTWFESLFEPPDPRRCKRVTEPPLVAYHWTAESPQAHEIANISLSGLYLLTEERWPVGGSICMTLQRTDKVRGSRGSWIAVEFVVVRWCEDGLAGAFIPFEPGRSNPALGIAENCADEKTLERFVKRLGSRAPHSHQQ